MQRLLRLLYAGPRGDAAAVVNPYRDTSAEHDHELGWRRRRRNLERYLEAVGRPETLLVGEAMGFRGGRFSGIAFTSERQLVGPRACRLPWAEQGFHSSSRKPCYWLEPSATTIWGALAGEARGTLLWNAFPWHPHAASGALSNRTPEPALLRANLHVLAALLDAFPAARPVAVGRVAQAALSRLGVATVTALRHPAYGGAALFRRQWAALTETARRRPLVGPVAAAPARLQAVRARMHSN